MNLKTSIQSEYINNIKILSEILSILYFFKYALLQNKNKIFAHKN